MQLKTKSVLITGCSAGAIGSALVEALQKRGVHVFATARSLSKMSHLNELPDVSLLELDVASSTSIAAALEAVKDKTGGKLDYLVNNSGQAMVMPTLDTDIEEGKKVFDVNFWGVLAIIQAFALLLISSKGTIVNVCSISGYLNPPWMGDINPGFHNMFWKACQYSCLSVGLYGASKAVLMIHSETLRLEMAPFGVKVLAIVTGAIATNIMSHAPKDYHLPPNSIYTKAFKEIKGRANGEDVKSRTDANEFAPKLLEILWVEPPDGSGEEPCHLLYVSCRPLCQVL